MQLIGAGAVLVYLVGVLDDMVGVNRAIRYFIQILVALAFPCCNLYINNLMGLFGIGAVPYWVGGILTILFVFIIFNAIQSLERSSSYSFLMPIITISVYSLMFALWHLPLFYITSLAILGPLMSFLICKKTSKNIKVRSIHLGRSGSLYMATVISYMALKSSMINENVVLSNHNGLAITVSLLFLPCADLLRVFFSMIFRSDVYNRNQRLFIFDKLKGMRISSELATISLCLLYIGFLIIDTLLISLEMNITWMLLLNICLFTIVNIWIPLPRTTEASNSGEPKRILFCDNTLWGLVNFRGDIMRYFINQGHQVYVVAPEKEDEQMRIDIPEGVRFIPIAMGRTSTSPINDLKYFLSLWRIYGEVQPDFCFHYTIKPNIYGSIAASLRGVRCTTAMVAGLGYVFNSNSLSASVARILYRIGLKFTNYLFVLNEGNRLLLLEKGLCKEEKLILLRGGEGIDVNKFAFYPNSPAEPATFTFIGRVLFDKGYAEFVEAAEIVKAQHPETKFEIWGSLDPMFPNAVPLHRLQYDIGRKLVSYKGFTQNMTDVYNRSGIVIVIPSYHEGMNRALMEACSTGKPIICSRIHGCMEMVQEGVNGYTIAPRDGKALADAMLRYIQLTSEEKTNMSKMSRLLAEREFSLEQVILQYKKILETS